MPRKSAIQIVLTRDERIELERRERSLASPHRVVVRARVVLQVADGNSLAATARQVGLRVRIVQKWALRFVRKRLAGLKDEPRSGRPPLFSPGSGDPFGEAGVRTS